MHVVYAYVRNWRFANEVCGEIFKIVRHIETKIHLIKLAISKKSGQKSLKN